ncbi:MAG: hypothetical protein HRT47_10750 [Candidatus Caenarcaniphilales bacterium]|nr:hypothetical protein [Candidatus Caenarcaniphilales bacterium]
MESICSISNERFLIAESPYRDKGINFERIFLVSLDESSDLILKVERTFKFAKGLNEVESLACIQDKNDKDRIDLLYAERNKGDLYKLNLNIKSDKQILEPKLLGKLKTSEDFEKKFKDFEKNFKRPDLRVVSSFTIDPVFKNLYYSSTIDPGENSKEKDVGPFLSQVFKVNLKQVLEGNIPNNQKPVANIDGVKIEGLAFDNEAVLWFATDDEDFGGIIRPLFIAR